jgi:hypothetical protein
MEIYFFPTSFFFLDRRKREISSYIQYKSRDGGERGSSPAVEDVARDREEGAEALRHHATTAGSRN